jgi:hypothetical protein
MAYKIVAGNSAGIKVTVSPGIEEPYSRLQSLAERGNHWARICVANINSLASGHFKSNVFVQSDGFAKFPEFTMILPGCMVQIRKRSNSDYLIFNASSNSDYQSLQKAFKKPGLFRVKQGQNNLKAEIVPDGNILDKENRVVTISDQYDLPDEAAKDCNRATSDSPWSQFAKRNGFDMHFTPGEVKIGGLKRLNQAQNADICPELRESALLLANTMYSSRGVAGVNWVSRGGGSGVLTQAMSILKDRRVNFNSSEHRIFFSGITTNLVKAEGLARDIGMKFERSTKSIGGLQSMVGSGMGGAFAAAYYRYKHDPEKYTALKMGTDMYKDSGLARLKEVNKAAKLYGITTVVVGTALGVSTGAIGLAAGIATAAAFGFKAVSWGAKTYAPDFYDKIAGKF